jgi:tetratricopeptide (TPR) repeat protein
VKLRTLCLSILLLTATAQAAPTAEQKEAASRAYADGKRYYDVGDWADALAAFKRAYLAYEEPTFLFNMAQCHRQLGNKQEAIKIYRSYLRNSPDAENRSEVQRIIGELEASLRADRAAAEARERASQTPPQDTTPPRLTSTPAVATTPTLTARAPERPKRKLWVLGVVGGVAAAGLAVGLGVGLTVGRPNEASLSRVQVP